MTAPDLQALAADLELAHDLDGARARRAAELLAAQGGAGEVKPENFATTDAVIGLVDRILPGWTITIDGQARQPDGHWHCHLRRSDDPDLDDEIIGSGKGPTLRLALLAATMRVVDYRARHRAAG